MGGSEVGQPLEPWPCTGPLQQALVSYQLPSTDAGTPEHWRAPGGRCAERAALLAGSSGEGGWRPSRRGSLLRGHQGSKFVRCCCRRPRGDAWVEQAGRSVSAVAARQRCPPRPRRASHPHRWPGASRIAAALAVRVPLRCTMCQFLWTVRLFWLQDVSGSVSHVPRGRKSTEFMSSKRIHIAVKSVTFIGFDSNCGRNDRTMDSVRTTEACPGASVARILTDT